MEEHETKVKHFFTGRFFQLVYKKANYSKKYSPALQLMDADSCKIVRFYRLLTCSD